MIPIPSAWILVCCSVCYFSFISGWSPDCCSHFAVYTFHIWPRRLFSFLIETFHLSHSFLIISIMLHKFSWNAAQIKVIFIQLLARHCSSLGAGAFSVVTATTRKWVRVLAKPWLLHETAASDKMMAVSGSWWLHTAHTTWVNLWQHSVLSQTCLAFHCLWYTPVLTVAAGRKWRDQILCHRCCWKAWSWATKKTQDILVALNNFSNWFGI